MNGNAPPPTSAPIDRYTDDASNKRGALPRRGAGSGLPTRCPDPQLAGKTAVTTSATRRITCPASNRDVSFAHNSHGSRKPGRQGDRRLPSPPAPPRRGEGGGGPPRASPGG